MQTPPVLPKRDNPILWVPSRKGDGYEGREIFPFVLCCYLQQNFIYLVILARAQVGDELLEETTPKCTLLR